MNVPCTDVSWTARRRAALVKALLRGEITVVEAAYWHCLPPAEIERWVAAAEAALENALDTGSSDLACLYERRITELQTAHDEAMRELDTWRQLARQPWAGLAS